MKTKQLFIASLCILLFIACNNKVKDEKAMFGAQLLQVEPDQIKSGGDFQTPSADSIPIPGSIKQVLNTDWDRKIIKNATLKLEVKDFKSYNELVHRTIKQYGGYIAREEQSLSDERTETTMSMKVPVEQFESMMNQLPGNDTKTIERKITTDDVSTQMVDVRSRAESKKQVRLKYLEFMKQSKNMTEVIQVQKEIDGIQAEIEAAFNHIDYLSHQSAFSTINLIFFQPITGFKPVDENPGFFTRVSFAFRSGVSWVADVFVGLTAIWPFILLLIIALVAWKKSKIHRPIRQNS